MLYPAAFNGRVFQRSVHFTVTFLTLITSSTNYSVTRKFQTNYVIWPAPKAKLPYTECVRTFNRSGPNTMTCANVSVKQYIGISDILLKFQTRATISRRGRDGRDWKREREREREECGPIGGS